MEGGKNLHVHYLKGLESVVLGFHIYMKGWGLVGGISGWCVSC
jgi:hypothetical protein